MEIKNYDEHEDEIGGVGPALVTAVIGAGLRVRDAFSKARRIHLSELEELMGKTKRKISIRIRVPRKKTKKVRNKNGEIEEREVACLFGARTARDTLEMTGSEFVKYLQEACPYIAQGVPVIKRGDTISVDFNYLKRDGNKILKNEEAHYELRL